MLRRLRSAFSSRTRQQRRERFARFIDHLPDPLTILDLGGTYRFWLSWYDALGRDIRVTALNNHHIDKTAIRHGSDDPDWYDEIDMDVRDLSGSDIDEHGLIFSNSFLEHLEDFETQRNVAEKIERSNKPYFLQVPNKYSIVDPHFPFPIVPYFASYPRGVQARLLTYSALGSGNKEPNMTTALERLRYYNPLSDRDLSILFPSATHEPEKTLGFVRSLLVMRAIG
jgi:hypothetical protein